ncbi:MAG: thioredoxin [Calditrichaeota bacterium]|nr:MAG: thioredoxin [Calditrichota bacterium]
MSTSFETRVLTESRRPVLVFAHAPWCSGCKAMAPRVKQLAAGHDDFVLFELNVEKEPDIARQFKIMGVPTFLIFRHGRLVDRKTGAIKTERLRKKIEKAMSMSPETAEANEITGIFRWPFKRKKS